MASRKPPRGAGRGADAPPVTVDQVREALGHIPPDLDRETWVRVAMAVKSAGLAAGEAFALFEQWSSKGESYNAAAVRDTWRSVKPGGAVKVATLFGIAKDHGYRPPRRAQTSAAQTPAPAKPRASKDAQQLAEREAEAAQYRERADQAARAARELWAQGRAAGASGYLERKRVAAHGVRFLADGTLLVPMVDGAGELQNLQRIAPVKPASGTDKRYLPGSRKKGLRHLVGLLDEATPVLLLAEGYATAASVHEATGRPVMACFDAGNLEHVARELRQAHPALPLLVCADDDAETEARTGKNPGRDKAATAARVAATDAAPAAVVVPVFTDPRPAGASDFNDLALTEGADAVRRIVEAAVVALLAGELKPPAPKRRQAGQEGPGDAIDGADDGEAGEDGSAPPEGAEAFPGGRDPFTLDEQGVWYSTRDRDGNETRPTWLCAPLAVTARTRADDANGWGYLLEFSDPDGNAKTWAMPAAMLSGEGAEWAGRLRDMGLRMAPGTAPRNRVAQYIETRGPRERVTCTDRVGWHGAVYVLPSGCIASEAVLADGRRYVFQSDSGMEETFRRHGELDQWRRQVAALAAGNSRLVFALCCAFGGPVLHPAGVESGGFHLRGTSSMGKTTALRVAASVWGRPTFMQRWRTTDNALEATAVQHCDGLLILDEFSQLDPRVAGECAYLLANESMKSRSSRNGVNRKRSTWRLLFLSSGEVSLQDHMAEANRRTHAGMEVRMVDVPLDAGAGMGGLEETHGHDGAARLADAITAAAARYYGTAGRAWLGWCCEQHAELPKRLQQLIDQYRDELVPEAAAEQVRRVGSRFALVAAAGELATEAGITGWQPGHAAWGVRRCFNDWLGARGHLDNGENAAMEAAVRAWLEKNADALLTWTHRAMDDHKAATPLRAGFKRMVDETGQPLKLDAAFDYVEKRSSAASSERASALVEYLILPEAFRREVCKGFDHQAVGKLLVARGHLVHQKNRHTDKQRLPGLGNVWCYHVKASIFEG